MCSDETSSTLQTTFDLCISTKNWPNLTPKYQLNNCKENYNILTGIMVFCKEVPDLTKCSHSAVSTGNNIFPIGIMKFEE